MMKGLNIALAVMLGMALLLAPASTVLAQEGEVVAEGFNGPQGVLVAPDGSIWVVDSGLGGDTPIQMVDPATGQISEAMSGDTSRVIQVLPDGTQNEVATLPSVAVGQDMIGGARLALMNDKLYATSGEWHEQQGDKTEELMAAIVEIGEDGSVTPVADTWRSERRMNPDAAQRHSHPYGMAAGPDGKLWVTDAGGNSLLKIGPDAGFIETIAAFAPLPGVFPNPNRGGEMLTDAVPTGITFDDEGNGYVSLLSGAPFVPGSAKVMKVSPTGSVSEFATGLTMLTDIGAGPDGNLYAVQFGQFTDQGPTPDSGAIVQVVEGEGSTPVVEGLSFPTSIGFNDAGDAFVTTNGVGAPGSGQVVKFAGLAGTGMADEEMAAGEEAAEGDMAEGEEAAEGDMAAGEEAAEGDMAEGEEATEGDMAAGEEAAEGDMAEGDMAEGDMAEGDMAEGDMAAPEHLPATGASLPVSGPLATTVATLGLAAVGLFIARRRMN